MQSNPQNPRHKLYFLHHRLSNIISSTFNKFYFKQKNGSYFCNCLTMLQEKYSVLKSVVTFLVNFLVTNSQKTLTFFLFFMGLPGLNPTSLYSCKSFLLTGLRDELSFLKVLLSFKCVIIVSLILSIQFLVSLN